MDLLAVIEVSGVGTRYAAGSKSLRKGLGGSCKKNSSGVRNDMPTFEAKFLSESAESRMSLCLELTGLSKSGLL